LTRDGETERVHTHQNNREKGHSNEFALS